MSSQKIEYRTDLTPEQRGRRLITILREIVPDEVYHVPGDGEFLWNFAYLCENIDDDIKEDIETSQDVRRRGRAPRRVRVVPENFCGTVGCAAGLGYLLGLIENPYPDSIDMARELDIPESCARQIFFESGTYNKFDDFHAVTPGQVADALEAELNRRR